MLMNYSLQVAQRIFYLESTIQSALTNDYNIVVVEDGHITGDRPHLKAEKVIEYYNWVWRHMIPTNGKVKVEKAEFIKTHHNKASYEKP